MDRNPYQAPEAPASPQRTENPRAGRWATLSLILGALAIPVYCIPPLCLLLATTSIVLGVLGLRSPRWDQASLGIGCSVVALLLLAFLLALVRSFPQPYQ